MVDGVPANDPYFRIIDWRQIPKEAVERIEVIRGGGASSLWGNLAMGIVNIVTRDPGKGDRSVSLSGGTYGTWGLDGNLLVLANDTLSLGILASASGSDGYMQTPDAYSNPRMAPTASKSQDVLVSAVLAPSAVSRYCAKLTAYRALSRPPPATR